MFRCIFLRPVRMEGLPEVLIKINVKEGDKAYAVHARIPGMNKEDIHITIDLVLLNKASSQSMRGRCSYCQVSTDYAYKGRWQAIFFYWVTDRVASGLKCAPVSMP